MTFLPVNHPFVKRMQNPVRMKKRKARGPVTTVKGPVTKLRYRFGGQNPYTWVDERDVNALIVMTKNPGSVYMVDPDQTRDDDPAYENVILAPTNMSFEQALEQVANPVQVKPKERVEEEIVVEDVVVDTEFEEEVFGDLEKVVEEVVEEDDVDDDEEDEQEPFDFMSINGIGARTMADIIESGITTLQELHEAGKEFIVGLPYVNEEKAEYIYQQIEKLLKQEN